MASQDEKQDPVPPDIQRDDTTRARGRLLEIRNGQQDEQAQIELDNEINYLKSERDEIINDLYIHGRDYWIKLRKYGADKNELLKICKKSQATHLSRMIITAYAYGPELAGISGRPFRTTAMVVPLIKIVLGALKQDSRLKKAFYGQDSDGDLAGLNRV
ncbi:unnamed protein product [Phytophthora fragariaefolia]|uniref:Unnamed protein product n=1 Tax=Phytophthora fragariaefolia TaxID=1490495 RepID=A0A9W6XSN5_9STRA|nr:unnamed protein product [Phytophthora fragariaefolia]